MSCNKERRLEIPICAQKKDFLPSYASTLAAGADLKACLEADVVLGAGCSTLVPTGVRVAIPEGYEIQIRPRSGLALKEQVTVLNTPGTIDADYRGEIKVILINHGKKDFIIQPGMRIAQLVLAPVYQACFLHVEELNDTARGQNGFGHTGTH